MRINSENIFLVDGLGAIFSASILGMILVNSQGLFGMPQEVLFFLMVVACVLSFYSLSCHFTSPINWRPFLLFIGIFNAIYCLVSIGFVIYYFANLTTFGITYFLLEIMVIGLLVFTEFRIVVSSNPL